MGIIKSYPKLDGIMTSDGKICDFATPKMMGGAGIAISAKSKYIKEAVKILDTFTVQQDNSIATMVSRE